ncbi:VanZ family protein [Georgenia sp. 311]|uniref:VanZ family protein n=1 Tax=Georgenia wutianyii TaxID=2585135 RepID=A0ABX5VNJ6_9MICO|nr:MULTISPECIES: VanZ family protein [Georgenia]QDB80062.1 VanZ family protein [Georgenia wutianyii]TNC17354.1 VanZ family protein [Georgenia sp. 311]
MPVHLRRLLLVLALLLHLAVLYAPRVPATGAVGVPGADKVVHVAVFALVVALALWSALPARWVVPLALAHAVGSEVVQHVFLADRSGDPWDVVADILGVGLGWVAGVALSRRSAARGPSGRVR